MPDDASAASATFIPKDTGETMVDVAKTIDIIRNRSAENQTAVRYDGRLLVPGDLVDQPNLDMSLLDAVLT